MVTSNTSRMASQAVCMDSTGSIALLVKRIGRSSLRHPGDPVAGDRLAGAGVAIDRPARRRGLRE